MSLHRLTIAGLLASAALLSSAPVSAQTGGSIVMRLPIPKEASTPPATQLGGASWRTGDWTWSSAEYCSTAAPQTRSVDCMRNGAVVASAACAATPRPDAARTTPRTSGCQFIWKAGTWSDPVPACGETTQSRTMTCTRSDGTTVEDALCTTAKGETTQPSVDFSHCSYSWGIGEWDEWSSRCSSTAKRKREVVCTRADGAPFDDSRCTTDKPAKEETASLFDSCGHQWQMGAWTSGADATRCGGHEESRIVRCVSESGSGAEDSECTEEKPETGRTVVDLSGCTADSYEWDVGAWSNDEPSCRTIAQERTAICRRADGVAVEPAKCTKPLQTSRVIDDNRTCSYQWEATPWSDWDSTCSDLAKRERTVECRRSDGIVSIDARCVGNKPSPNEVGQVYSGCGFSWAAEPWSTPRGCGDVPETRKVSCMRSDGQKVDDGSCAGAPRPADSQMTKNYDTCGYSYQPRAWSDWSSQCSATAERTRALDCVRDDGSPVSADMCKNASPVSAKETSAIYTACTYKWLDDGWIKPAPTCGPNKTFQSFVCLRSDGSRVEDQDCQDPKPVVSKPGFDDSTCTYAWTAGDWNAWGSTCSATATRTRDVQCISSSGMPAPGKCQGTVPAASETAEIYTGCSYDWKLSDWTSAPYCGAVTENRSAECIRTDGKAVADSLCGTKPATQRAGTNYSACTYAWATGTWSNYSSTCSTTAMRTRNVTCERSDKTEAPGQLCSGTKPDASETAGVFTGCTYKWTTSAWNSTYSCSEADVQTRTVSCSRVDDVSSVVPDASCSGAGTKPVSSQTVSNTSSCSTSVVNGGFENGLYGWNSTAPADVSTTVAHGGTMSVKLDPNGQLRQYIKTVNGQRYTLTYWAYTRNGLYMNSYGPQGKVIENRALGNSAYQWVFFSGTFTGTGGVVQLGFYHYAPSGGTSWIDDMTVTPG